MILEVAILNVRDGSAEEFEVAFAQAHSIIASMSGYVSHQLPRCSENPQQYLLLVQWQTLEDHTQGSRESAEYHECRRLLHHFYDPFPTINHYEAVVNGGKSG